MEPDRKLLFWLSIRLGYPNPDELFARLPWRIWEEWRIFNSLEPLDDSKEDFRAAQLAMLFANAWFRGKQNSKAWTIEDFIPQVEGKWEKPKETEEQRAERLLAWAKDVTILMGGTVDI